MHAVPCAKKPLPPKNWLSSAARDSAGTALNGRLLSANTVERESGRWIIPAPTRSLCASDVTRITILAAFAVGE